jgi:glycerol-3-phosphate acyltransferase PlsX
MLGYLFAKKGVKLMQHRWDYRTTGGSMLLGLNGVIVKAHGSSDRLAFSYAMEVGKKLAEANIVETMKKGFANATGSTTTGSTSTPTS